MADCIITDDDFDVPDPLTAEWLRNHIEGLQRIEADAKKEFEEYLAQNPEPKGEEYQRTWRLRQRREGARGLIEIHSNTLRTIEAKSYVPPPRKAIKNLEPLPPRVKRSDSPATPIHRGIDDVIEGEEGDEQ